MSRNLIICCDGTNNQFGAQNTNVVRMIQILERDPQKQRLYYDPGVGTLPEPGVLTWLGKKLSEWWGLAFGTGLTRNVEEAYCYLMDMWEPGDRVFLFGFSRGAFTARTLVGLIDSQGLVPAEIDGNPVSHAEMKRNAMMAWRAYREHSVPMSKSLPTIWIARWIRNFVLWLYHLIMRHRSYEQVKAAMGERKNVEIAFL